MHIVFVICASISKRHRPQTNLLTDFSPPLQPPPTHLHDLSKRIPQLHPSLPHGPHIVRMPHASCLNALGAQLVPSSFVLTRFVLNVCRDDGEEGMGGERKYLLEGESR